ncbi:asparaginase [Arsenicitalea aurantiaca]|uniref:Asparaginase n=2 Tax=Arsenicitalea aurantiaca TaxID=1783274 RepID=A0A433XH06_9HYPH|nr:asparaginase [Arsenicitalea aurantiaca]
MSFAVTAQEATEDSADLPIVYVLATGGTIAGQGASAVRPAEYQGAQLSGNELVDAIPELAQLADTRVVQISNVGSPSMTFVEWKALAEEANRLLNSEEENVAGIVVTHGTNTLEETAYFLNLTVKSEKPVVVIGAQRPATALSADGPYNLYTAVRLAADPVAVGRGVMVAMNEEINSARDVFKSDTYRVEAFRSGDLGFLGYIDTDKITFYREPLQRHTINSEFDISTIDELPQVEIVYSYVEASGLPITAFAEAGVEGLVIAGHGAGGNSPAQTTAIDELREAGNEMIVVRSNHTGNGRVLDRAGNFERLVLHADNLQPKKARILLQLALATTDDPAEIQRMLSEY